MKNKLLSIIISITLLMPAVVWAVDGVAMPVEELVPIEELNENVSAEQQNVDEAVQTEEQPEIETEKQLLPYKKPISKRKLIKKFLLAMFYVGVFSILLYIGLNLYKRAKENIPPQVKTPEGETPLTTPGDIESAAKIFLSKTKW